VPILVIKQDRDWQFLLHHPPVAASAPAPQRSEGDGAQYNYEGPSKPAAARQSMAAIAAMVQPELPISVLFMIRANSIYSLEL
jgi:hypothetical protein